MASNFIITTAGLAAASTAGSGGPEIDIVSFKIGSGFNYTPLAGHTGLNGSTLYTGTIAAATPYDGDTMDIIIQLPADVGPFQFGEIGLFMAANVMFAKCAYTTLQTKLSDAVNGVGSVWTIHCLIKLADASALFNYVLAPSTSIPIIAGAGVVGPDAVDPLCNAIIAMEYAGRRGLSPILLVRESSTTWSVPGVNFCGQVTPTSVTTTSMTSMGMFGAGMAACRTSPSNRYLIIRLSTGQIVPVVSVNNATGTATLQRAVSWMSTSAGYAVYDMETATPYNAYLRGTPTCDTPPLDVGSDRVLNANWFFNMKSNVNPQMAGTAAIGSSNHWADAEHVHPTDSSRAPVQNPTVRGTASYDPGNLGTNYEIGFRDTPPVLTAPASLASSHRGKCIYNVAVGNSGSGTINVPAGLPNGSTFAIDNNCSNGTDTITITFGAGVTGRLAGTTLTGTRTMAPQGICSILISNGGANAKISGAGVY